MVKEGVVMETMTTITMEITPTTCETPSTSPPEEILGSNHDSGTVQHPSKVASTKDQSDLCLKPNFRVGTSERDKSSEPFSPVDGSGALNVNSSTSTPPHPVTGDGTVHFISSAEHSDDTETQLSLVSWYSEPGEGGGVLPLQSCCLKRCGLKKPSSIHMALPGDKLGKENKTPTSITGSKGKSTGASKNLKTTMRIQNPDKKNKRLDSSGCKVGTSTDINETITNGHENLECPRCSRKSKSGSATPATPSRSPKRQLTPKKLIPNLKKPIKSILRTSSGSGKQSSMDSVNSSNSNGGGGFNSNQMTRSDLGQQLKTKFKLDDLSGTRWNEGDFTGLKRIERYATLRIRKPRPAMQTTDNHDVSSGTDSPSDLMTKSLTYLKTSSPTGDPDLSPAPFQRSGSLRSRKAGPTVQPCATRTSALRLLKIQEKNAKLQNGREKSNSDCSEFNSNGNQLVPSKLPNNSVRKVFSKLSSAFGQTASSSQKRLRQERGIQTDPILIIRTEARGGGSFSVNGNSRSPTPMSPFPTTPDAPCEELAPAEEIIRLRQELAKSKAKLTKYQHLYSEAEHENVLMGNHLQDLERESKEMINFLQDEKSMLTESLAEAEVEILVLSEKLETQSKVVQKLEVKLTTGAERYRSNMKEAKQNVEEQTSDLDSESTKTKKLQAEIAILKKRVEKLNLEQPDDAVTD